MRRSILLVPLLASFTLLASALTAQTGPVHLVYSAEVRPDDPGVYHFTLEVTNPGNASGHRAGQKEGGPAPADSLLFVMPYWAPGSYRPLTAVRNEPASKGIRQVRAEDENGAPRTVEAVGDRSWRVAVGGARKLVFRYANETPGKGANNRSFLARDTGLIDGPRSWVYVDGLKDLPVHVRFRLPEGWRVGTGLEPTVDPFVFHADDYDRLADCPTAVGLFEEWLFEVRGVPHRILALTGDRKIEFDPAPFVAGVKRIVETYVAVFDDVPYPHYTFIYTSGGGGGLEHLTSTTISVQPAHGLSLAGSDSVTAHEFFHTWNVKRLRPFALGPFDYTQPVRVNDLWICEGITSYYTTLGLWRAGLSSDEEFLGSYRGNILRFVRDPAHLIVAPEQASWTVWDRDRPYSMDYYLQGEVLGLMIDLAIRDGSGNRKSFDDVMRALYAKYGGYYRHQPPKPGYRSEDVLSTIRQETGVDLGDFWARHVRGAEEVEWNRWLKAAGWEIETREKTVNALASGRRGTASPDGGVVLEVGDGDAWSRAGFRNGDRVVSVGGKEVSNPRGLAAAFAALEGGSEFNASVARGAETVEVRGKVEAANDIAVLGIDESDGAVVLTGVPAGSRGAQAGLVTGDRLQSIDGNAVASADAARKALADVKPGANVLFGVFRGGETMSFEVEAAPLKRLETGILRPVAQPTPRQLAIRQGLRDGTALGVPQDPATR